MIGTVAFARPFYFWAIRSGRRSTDFTGMAKVSSSWCSATSPPSCSVAEQDRSRRQARYPKIRPRLVTIDMTEEHHRARVTAIRVQEHAFPSRPDAPPPGT